jgi:hypothetical protein
VVAEMPCLEAFREKARLDDFSKKNGSKVKTKTLSHLDLTHIWTGGHLLKSWGQSPVFWRSWLFRPTMSVTMMPRRPRLKEATRKAMFSSSSYAKQNITWHCALRMRRLKVRAMRVSVVFRAILIIAKLSTFVFFSPKRIWWRKVSFVFC